MALSIEDRLKLLIPSPIYYRHKIKSEILKGEPEIAILRQLISTRGGTAVDVGANRGIYSYELADICDLVLAFEPNPDIANFARWKLPKNVDVLNFALGSVNTQANLWVQIDGRGRDIHLQGQIRDTPDDTTSRSHQVIVRRLDDIKTSNVKFIKIDVEGKELDVIFGAENTISRDRPVLLVELLAGYHPDPVNCVKLICRNHCYEAFYFVDHQMTSAVEYFQAGHTLSSRNVVFIPKSRVG